jgi:hypothetical protein
MNTKEMLKTLSHHFSDVECHTTFLEELSKIIKKELSGKEKQVFKQLTVQLENIRSMGCLVHTADHNEKLKHLDGHYYSIHLESSQYNVRLLIYITDENTAYFLCAFYERSGKSRTNYSQYTPILKKRLKQMLGDDEDE